MAELPRWFPRNMVDVYRMRDLELPPTIDDPRVADSYGGGACPEQHWGTLTDARVFYFRMRSNCARLCLAPTWWEPDRLPTRNPLVTMEMWDGANARGEDPPILWLGPCGFVDEVYPGDDYIGFFETPEDRSRVFGACLDQVWKAAFEPGWYAVFETDPGWNPRRR